MKYDVFFITITMGLFLRSRISLSLSNTEESIMLNTQCSSSGNRDSMFFISFTLSPMEKYEQNEKFITKMSTFLFSVELLRCLCYIIYAIL